MSEMIVQVRNKMLRRIGGVNHFVSHNKDYTIQFQFDESWDNVRTKMAVFAYEDGEYGSEIFDGDTCNVPELPREGRILIGVKAGEDLSTELLCIPVCKSADDVITDEYDEPDPKIYEQILDIINNLWNGGTTVYPSPVRFLAAPNKAKVGQFVRVKKVDENGEIKETEAVDVEKELVVVNITEDADGVFHADMTYDEINPLRYTHAVYAKWVSGMYPYSTSARMYFGEDLKNVFVFSSSMAGIENWHIAIAQDGSVKISSYELELVGRKVQTIDETTGTGNDAEKNYPSVKAVYDALANVKDKDAVKFVEQELTDEQKQQARENILALGFTQLCDDSIEGWHDSADSKYTQALGLTNYDFPLYVRYVQSYGSTVTEYALTTIRGKMCFVIRYLSSGKIQETSLWYSSMTINNITQKDDGAYNFKWTLDQILSHLQEGKYVCAKFNGYILPVIKVTDSAVYYAGVDSDNNLVTATQSNSEQTVRIKPHNFIVTLSHDQKNNQYSVDKNFSEVLSACKDGSTVVVNFNNVIIPIADFGDSRISFTISLPGFATFLVFLEKGDNDVCNIAFNGFPHYEFSALYVNFSDGESEGLLDSNCTYDSLMEQTVFERNVYGYYQARELTLTKYPSSEDGDLAYFSFTGVNPVDDKVYFERIDYKQDGTITYQKKEVCTDIDVMTGATSTEGGSSGLVPAPGQAVSLTSKFLNDRGVWEEPFPLYSWYNLSLLSNTGTNLPRSIIITQNYVNPVSGVPEDAFGLLIFTTTDREYLKYIMFGSSGKIYDVDYNRGTERYYYYESKYSLPTVSTSDNNKILQVSNGAWAASDFPTASPTTLGGVKPIAKTDSMTQEVGIDADGKLYTKPSSSSGGSITFEQDGDYISITSTGVTITEENGYITIS